MTPEALKAQLQRQLAALNPPDAVASRKQAALEAFNEAGFPTRKHENWKYTDVRALAEGEFDLTWPAPDAEAEQAAAERIAQAGIGSGPCYVFVDGWFSAALSSTETPAGITLEPEAEVRTRTGLEAPSPLATLNAAFTHRGATLRVADKARVTEPVELVFVGSPRVGIAPQLRLAVEIGAQAEITLVQHFIDCGGADDETGTWLNAVVDIIQQPASRLTLYRLQDHAHNRYQTNLLEAELGRDAHIAAGYVEVGGRLVRNDINVSLNEPGASADLFGVTLGNGERLVDNHVRVDHAAAHTTSTQTFRTIVDDKSRAVFNGKVIVRPDAQHIDSRQSSDNLLLSKRAEVDTKPELEIYADDVKCAHGATVGELDEQQMFYLRTRGVDAVAARGLLTFAFANAVLEKIGVDTLRDTAAQRVAGVLPDSERWEELA